MPAAERLLFLSVLTASLGGPAACAAGVEPPARAAGAARAGDSPRPATRSPAPSGSPSAAPSSTPSATAQAASAAPAAPAASSTPLSQMALLRVTATIEADGRVTLAAETQLTSGSVTWRARHARGHDTGAFSARTGMQTVWTPSEDGPLDLLATLQGDDGCKAQTLMPTRIEGTTIHIPAGARRVSAQCVGGSR